LRHGKEQIVSNRVLNRKGARELTSEEIEQAAAAGTGCFSTDTRPGGPVDDFGCDL
jgi:hypothetical protein